MFDGESTTTRRGAGTVAPPPRVAIAVRELIGRVGEARAAERLRVSRTTLARIAGRLTVHRGSVVLAAQALGIEIENTEDAPGVPLDAHILATLRALIASDGAQRLVYRTGVSLPALEQAASGGRVLRGTGTLIALGLDRMREAGELLEAPPPTRKRKR